MTWEIDISIGPVQGFVAQSRRTQDLWGSSYLLSYLSAHAMRGASRDGEVVRPRVEHDPLYQWVSGAPGAHQPPLIGSVPNHFIVRTSGEPREVAGAAVDAFQAAWRRVHEAVWRCFVRHANDHGNGTEEIWWRQVESCWEITWVVGPIGETGGLRARRKLWRTHRLPAEPGDKCTVMRDFQELSGHVRAAHGGPAQKQFWAAVRERVGRSAVQEDEEQLCAPALVKRFFARCGSDAIGGELDVDRWPSTVYIGAVPWLHQVRERASEQAEQYVRALGEFGVPGAVRRHIPVASLRDAEPDGFFKLDANLYHCQSVATLPGLDHAARSTLTELLKQVAKETQSGPPVYYAILLADGDHLGKLVAADEAKGGGKVSEALSRFGGQVRGIVEEHRGVTVYAGGDDVLAMLPMPGALVCAERLATAYREAFAPMQATLSAAVLFAHVRAPIGDTLASAHSLLNDVAKRANGRDSLAVEVRKPGGPHCRWVTSWTRTYPDRGQRQAIAQLAKLVEATSGDGDQRDFSASLLHHTRDVLDLLCGQRRWEPGTTGTLPAGLDLSAYLHAELVDSWEERKVDEVDESGSATRLADLTQLIVDLLGSSSGERNEDGGPVGVDASRTGLDALLLARFLAGGGREEEHG